MEAQDILTAIAAYSLALTAIVDAVRRRVPTLDGGQVQLLAFALAFVGVWQLDFRATAALVELLELPVGRIPAAGMDYAITAVAIMAGAGKLAELAKKPKAAIVEVNGSAAPR